MTHCNKLFWRTKHQLWVGNEVTVCCPLCRHIIFQADRSHPGIVKLSASVYPVSASWRSTTKYLSVGISKRAPVCASRVSIYWNARARDELFEDFGVLRIPVNVTDDSSNVTGIPANVTEG